MKKPCVLIELELLKNNEEKATFRFIELESNGSIVFNTKTHNILFRELCDYMKTGERFDFMNLNLECDIKQKEEVVKHE